MNPAYVVLAGSVGSVQRWRRQYNLAPRDAIFATERSLRGVIIHPEVTEVVELGSFMTLPFERRMAIRELIQSAT